MFGNVSPCIACQYSGGSDGKCHPPDTAIGISGDPPLAVLVLRPVIEVVPLPADIVRARTVDPLGERGRAAQRSPGPWRDPSVCATSPKRRSIRSPARRSAPPAVSSTGCSTGMAGREARRPALRWIHRTNPTLRGSSAPAAQESCRNPSYRREGRTRSASSTSHHQTATRPAQPARSFHDSPDPLNRGISRCQLAKEAAPKCVKSLDRVDFVGSS